jgi:arginine:pyruvate transaminase
VMPGASFGKQAAGHVRVSLSADAELLREAASRMVRLAIRLTQGKAA